MTALRQMLQPRMEQGSYALLEQCPDSAMKQVLRLVDVGACSKSVILRGETGVGKEVVAKALHEKGNRSGGKVVVLDCANQNQDIMGSELFGHEKGAFTGADKRHIGSFERANMGTLFLDEIGELPLVLQLRLLRVLEEGTFNRVGGETIITSDFNLVSATNSNLEKMVETGKFRRDLYYRLSIFPIAIPPLRERPKDITYLASYFVRNISDGKKELSSSSELKLQKHHWPGNVRELRNVMMRAVLLANGSGVIDPCHVRIESLTLNNGDLTEPQELMESFIRSMIKNGYHGKIDRKSKELLLEVSCKIFNNKRKASQALGIAQQTFYARLCRFRNLSKGSK